MNTIIEVKELTTLKGQVSKLENRAESVTIESQEKYEDAIDIVAKLKAIGSLIKKKKESITKPLNEALRNARNLFRPLEDQFDSAEKIVKSKILDYKRMMDAKAREEEEKIAKKVESGRMNLDTAEHKMDNVERVNTTTHGKVGSIQVRLLKKVRIVDVNLIPRQYLIPDMVMIRREAINNKVGIPGVEVYSEETIASGSSRH